MFPVEQCWPQVAASIQTSDIILMAPPGAGKSTVLPLKLLQLPEFKDNKIVMLQPRQVAVRAIAHHLASQLGEPVGKTIGYRMRGEQKTSKETRLEIVTEGLLTRMLQADPELSGVGLVIFDEFHERNVHADFSLALCLETQQGLREDLRLLVMSATLDNHALSKYLPAAELIISEGRSYPVDIFYRPKDRQTSLSDAMVAVICEALQQHQGNILAFLPGSADIHRLHESLLPHLDPATLCYPLYGNLPRDQQIAALADTPANKRKVVLATNIAETSLTIDGISVVVDSGLEKVASYDFTRQLQQLETSQISKASSVQRAGRAGRVMPGVCYRLWSQEQQQRLIEQQSAQITNIELSSLLLEAKVWGTDIEQLVLMDMPGKAQLAHGKDLLQHIGALDSAARLTAKGRKMAEFGCHPRLASLLYQAQHTSLKKARLACVLVALLESRSLPTKSALIEQQLDALRMQKHHPIWQDARRWAKKIGIPLPAESIDSEYYGLAELLIESFVDSVAKKRERAGYVLVNGTGATWSKFENADNNRYMAQWLVVASVTKSSQADGIIRLAQPITQQQVLECLSAQIDVHSEYYWHQTKQAVAVRQVKRLGSIVLEQRNQSVKDNQLCTAVLLKQIREKGLGALDWSPAVSQWRNRLLLAQQLEPQSWPDMTEQTLLATLENWLSPYLLEIGSWRQLQKLDWLAILSASLDYPQQQRLAREFPSHYVAPSGNKHRLDYTDNTVSLSLRIQEMYGCIETPSVAKGHYCIQLTLLSPAGRPIQTTSDLAGFWQGSYQQVKKEMKGRYPKHFWPDNPAESPATTRTKKNM